MQVTHLADHIESVLVGGEEAIELQVTDSAEFMLMMSSTLYKNQPLAVVRETLCNAWDIHIEDGITDKPVEVTIDSEKIVIKDYGHGIPKSLIGKIYGTYGNSTKKNDGNQTGGFGLGCKAPFCYADHFEVISKADGLQTIYNMSKSTGSIGGKPSIQPIVNLPTDESGLQVTIPIKQQDERLFTELFTTIAEHGDMNVLINGEPPENPLKMDLNLGFKITNRTMYKRRESNHRVMVRYGNVVYPVEIHSDYSYEYNKVINHIDSLNGRRAGLFIIFQAKPHSIAVQPSREGLSMQEHTINSIKELLTNFLKQVENNFVKEARSQIHDIVDTTAKLKEMKILTNRQAKLPRHEESDNLVRNYYQANDYNLDSWGSQVKHYLASYYPEFDRFYKEDILLRLDKMIEHGLGDRGLIQSFKKAIFEAEKRNSYRTNWFRQKIVKPLAVAVNEAGLSTKQLFVYDPENDMGAYEDDSWNSRNVNKPRLSPIDEAGPRVMLKAIGFLNKVAVLCGSEMSLLKRVESSQEFQKLVPRTNHNRYSYGWVLYKTKKKTDREVARKALESIGYTVVDLVDVQPWEPTYWDKNKPTEKPVKKTGLPLLSNAGLGKGGSKLSTKDFSLPTRNPDAIRSEDYEAVTCYSTHNMAKYRHPEIISGQWSDVITELYGDKVGVCLQQISYDKKIKEGYLDFKVYVLNQVAKYMLESVAIADYESSRIERIREAIKVKEEGLPQLNLFWTNNYLADKAKIVDIRTKQDKLMERLYVWLKDNWRTQFADNELCQKSVDHFIALKPRQDLVQLGKHLRDSKYVGLINCNYVEKNLVNRTEEIWELFQHVFNYKGKLHED